MMKTNNVFEKMVDVNGVPTLVTFDQVVASFSVTTALTEEGYISSAALRTTPYTKIDGKTIQTGSTDDARTLYVQDLFNCNDADVMEAVITINTAIGKLILKKNL